MKTKTTHTPGPWRYECHNAGEIGSKDKVTVEGPDGHIALVKRQQQENGRDTFGRAVIVKRPLDEVKANARLIAAAPELLEAARAAMDALVTIGKENWGAVERCRAAIAKAEGRE